MIGVTIFMNVCLSFIVLALLARKVEVYIIIMYFTISEGWNCPSRGIEIHREAALESVKTKP